MKTFLTISVMVVLTLAFGIAYADEFPIAVRDAGTELYLSEFPTHDAAVAAKDFGVIGDRGSESIEAGAVLNDDLRDSMLASSEAKGSAAGGVAKDDENTIIWDNLLGAPGGSDLP